MRNSFTPPEMSIDPPLLQNTRLLEGTKNKKEVENDLLSVLAPLSFESCNRFVVSKLVQCV